MVRAGEEKETQAGPVARRLAWLAAGTLFVVGGALPLFRGEFEPNLPRLTRTVRVETETATLACEPWPALATIVFGIGALAAAWLQLGGRLVLLSVAAYLGALGTLWLSTNRWTLPPAGPWDESVFPGLAGPAAPVTTAWPSWIWLAGAAAILLVLGVGDAIRRR